jgi:galacturonokinase
MKRIFSPYRLCPIGAHIDHQGGMVLGRTIKIGTSLEYDPIDSNEVHLTSDQFGQASFRIGELDRGHWSRYAQAAALVLSARRGLRVHVSGSLIGSGLSSSASVGLAYLKAFADANDIGLTDDELVQLEYRLEHDELNLQIGLLDPLTIVHGRQNALLLMDTLTATVMPISDPINPDFAWIVAYSGVSRELTKSGFNVRVEECRQAASRLKEGAEILSDVPRELFEEQKMSLPENLRRRAEHFFTEVDRVHLGARVWKEADIVRFGQLMNQSCASSINNYESGSEILIELHELVSSTNGIYGSRFSGGGYGGCVVALAKKDLAENACMEITDRFSAKHPNLPSRSFVAETGDSFITLPAGEGAEVQS